MTTLKKKENGTGCDVKNPTCNDAEHMIASSANHKNMISTSDVSLHELVKDASSRCMEATDEPHKNDTSSADKNKSVLCNISPPLPPPPPIAPPLPPPPPVSNKELSTLPKKMSPLSVSSLNAAVKSSEPSQMQPTVKDKKVQDRFRENLKRIVQQEIEQYQSHIAITSVKEVQPIIQDGPCCGIVALAMAAQMLDIKSVNVTDLLELSKKRGFSIQGEMFSAANMKMLMDEVFGCSSTVIDMSSPASRMTLMSYLARGQPVLVPYDADRNHQPCLKRGHKAHWALITGFLLFVDKKRYDDFPVLEKDPEIPNLYNLPTSVSPSNILGMFSNSSDSLYVYGVQGKSLHTGIWSLESLLSSNANLVEVEPKRSNDQSMYVLPSNGIQKELCNKIVAFNTDELTWQSYFWNTLNSFWSTCTYL